MAWAQRAAILANTPHPATAKLYPNWWLSKQTQANFHTWSIRTDVAPHPDHHPIRTYPNATSPASTAS